MNRRDLLLQQMNITQWILTKPQVLKGDAQIQLSPTIKLVVISEEDHQHSYLFQDILRALQLTAQEYQWLNFEQAMRLSITHQPLFWLIQPKEQAVKFTKKLTNPTAWHHPTWQAVQQPIVKRQFWQQIAPHCAYIEDTL